LLIGAHAFRAGWRTLLKLAAALVIAFAVAVQLFSRGLEAFALGGIAALAIALIVVAVMRWIRAKRDELPEMSWRLAIVPVELLTVLVLAILVLPLLQLTERRATNQFQKPAPYISDEIENSPYRDARNCCKTAAHPITHGARREAAWSPLVTMSYLPGKTVVTTGDQAAKRMHYFLLLVSFRLIAILFALWSALWAWRLRASGC
jgi:hypothetical protein